MHTSYLLVGNQQDTINKAREIAKQLLGSGPLNHPDYLLVNPEGQEKSRKTVISIDEVRKMQQTLFLKPYQAPYKVAVIFDAQRLSIQAQHALLKTLEEPPDKSVIILTAPSLELILLTIISRCYTLFLSNSRLEAKQEDQELVDQTGHLATLAPLSRLGFARQINSSGEHTKLWIVKQIALWRQLMLSQNGQINSFSPVIKFIRFLLLSLYLSDKNVNNKLLIEQILLRMPGEGGRILNQNIGHTSA